MKINGVSLGDALVPYVIAEMSGNHRNEYKFAEKLLVECATNGANAFKLQTYTPDSMTLNCKRPEYFVGNSPWEGKNLYELYAQGQTPAEWIPDLFEVARESKISIFSTPFSLKDVDILEENEVSAYKIASFEITYTQLLKYVGKTGKPVIFSTGMATLEEIRRAFETLGEAGAREISILKCSTSYPAHPKNLNFLTIPYLINTYGVPVGFSDHTIGTVAAIAAVALGATVLEKHVKLDEDQTSVDASFSLPVSALKEYIDVARTSALSRGGVQNGPTDDEETYMQYRRSIVASRNIEKGEIISHHNVRIVRPALGLAPEKLDSIIGLRSARFIEFGEGITFDNIS
jgi:pseudaminic acid synthase